MSIINQNYRSRYDCELVQMIQYGTSTTTLLCTLGHTAQLYPGLQIIGKIRYAIDTSNWSTLVINLASDIGAGTTVSTSVVFPNSGSFADGDVVRLTYDGSVWRGDATTSVAQPYPPLLMVIVPYQGVVAEANIVTGTSSLDFFTALNSGQVIYPFLMLGGTDLTDAVGVVGTIADLDLGNYSASISFDTGGIQITAIMNNGWSASDLTDPTSFVSAGRLRLYVTVPRKANETIAVADWSNNAATTVSSFSSVVVPDVGSRIIDITPSDTASKQAMIDCGVRAVSESYSTSDQELSVVFNCDVVPTHAINVTIVVRGVV